MSSSKKLTCKGTLQHVFIRVYRLERQSVMLVFSTRKVPLLFLDDNICFGVTSPWSDAKNAISGQLQVNFLR
jgi:hypothetical protein